MVCSCFFSVIDGNISEMTEKIKSFRSESLKIRSMNTVTAGLTFNITVRQMTEMSR